MGLRMEDEVSMKVYRPETKNLLGYDEQGNLLFSTVDGRWTRTTFDNDPKVRVLSPTEVVKEGKVVDMADREPRKVAKKVSKKVAKKKASKKMGE